MHAAVVAQPVSDTLLIFYESLISAILKIFLLSDNPSTGKPYSTLVQACCTNGFDGEIYDPDRFVCCNGEVIPMEDYKANKSQC